MLNVRVKKALLTILTACLTVLMMVGAVLGFTPATQPVKADTVKQFTKVTTAPADWSGTYLIVYEDGKVAFNGSLTKLDAAKNNVSVTITNGVIAYSDDLNGKTFTIAKSSSNYTIKSASGYNIGQTSNANGLKSSTSTTYANTLSINNDGSVNFVSGGAYLRFNAGTNDMRFRYYKSSSYTGQKAIHLYEYEEITSGGEGPTECQHPNAYEKYEIANGQHTWQRVCDDCNSVLETGTTEACATENWAWNTENGKHSRIGECDTCGAEMTESGNCTVSNATEYVSVSDKKHNAIGTCDICGNPTEVSEDCVYTKTAEDDNGVTYECESCDNTYTNLKYTITFHVPFGVAPVAARRVEQGKIEDLPVANVDDEKYTFAGWTTEGGYEGTTSPAIYASYTMGEENVDLYALYTYTEGSTETGYVKVTAANQLAVNDTIVIAANGFNKALGADRGNNREAAAITKEGDTITFEESAGVQLITLEEGAVDGTFAFKTDDGYLYAASSGSNQLKVKAALDVNGSWKIEINNGVATIKAPESSNRSWVRYNSTNNPPIFSCYTSGQADVCIYKLVSGTTYYVTDLEISGSNAGADLEPKIVSANLTLGKELVVNYKVSMHDSFADAEMTFTMNGKTTTVTGSYDEEGNVYVYSIAIAPQYMSANISAVLTYNGEELVSKDTYSVLEYANYWLDNTTGEEMTNLLNALLQYGAAAQMYKDVDTDNLVANLENLGEVPEDSNDASLVSEVAKENRGVSFKSAGVSFSSDNKIFVRLTNYDESVKLTVNGVDVTLNGAIYYTEGLLATQFGETFTFVLSYDGVVMQTLTYSVNAYAYTLQDSENADMANLAIALYNYGAAAEAYAN